MTRLIASDVHKRIHHNGERQKTLAELNNEFWIPKGKSYINKILHQCVICWKFNSKPYPYPNSFDFPEEHLSDKPCFSGVGGYYTGALTCKNIYFVESYLLVTVYDKLDLGRVV